MTRAGIFKRADGWPGVKISTVVRAWKDETVVLIGGGPSLEAAQVESAKSAGLRAIAVNDAYLIAPWADVCFFADSEWWGWHTMGIARPFLGLSADQVRQRFAEFDGDKCTIEDGGSNVTDPNVYMLRNAGLHGISRDPQAIYNGRNSGFMALNVAILAGATRILLLGFDARAPSDKPTHWFGEHPKTAALDVYAKYKAGFTATAGDIRARGVRVINCSPGSAIDAFERMSIDAAIAALVPKSQNYIRYEDCLLFNPSGS